MSSDVVMPAAMSAQWDDTDPWEMAVHTNRSRAQEAAQKAARVANELLISHLSPKQLADMSRLGKFLVTSRQSGRRYVIETKGTASNNIVSLDGAQGLCAHLDDQQLPYDDHFLAQKLLLEHDEDYFLRTANKFERTPAFISSVMRELAD